MEQNSITKTYNHGFTLIELAIVLAIIGLLVGGILAGQSLIRAAELRAVTSEYSRYVTALKAFRDQYSALPGDMPDATKYWGALGANDTVCRTTPSTDTKTCNGDGNGTIDYEWGYINKAGARDNEGYQAWQHLANAGFIAGSYTGSLTGTLNGHTNGNLSVPGQNKPGTRISPDGTWSLWYLAGRDINTWAPAEPGHYLGFGKNDTQQRWFNPILKPEDAHNLDAKIDDGNPHTGEFNTLGVGINNFNSNSGIDWTPNCTTDTTDAAQYNLTYTSIACTILIRAF